MTTVYQIPHQRSDRGLFLGILICVALLAAGLFWLAGHMGNRDETGEPTAAQAVTGAERVTQWRDEQLAGTEFSSLDVVEDEGQYRLRYLLASGESLDDVLVRYRAVCGDEPLGGAWSHPGDSVFLLNVPSSISSP